MTAPTDPPAAVPFRFTGTAGEYFGIWIVNLLLSVLTLGIYSAWAKVRTKQYFYQNTRVAGRSFDYHATGLQILIGRVIVVAGLIAYSVLSAIPVVGLVLIVALIFLFPFLMVRSIRFNARMSSWSNVRFGFDGATIQAFLAYLLYPVLTAFTAYLAWPFAERAIRRFAVSNHRLGGARFAFDSGLAPFYGAFLAALGWAALVIVIGFVTGRALLPSFDMADPEQLGPAGFMTIYGFIFVAFFPAQAIYTALIRNAVYNNARLDERHRFRSSVQPFELFWLVMTNFLAIVVTLGLAIPWAKVRMAHYMAEKTEFLPDGPLDAFVGEVESSGSAIGDAYTDIEGIDVGIPV